MTVPIISLTVGLSDVGRVSQTRMVTLCFFEGMGLQGIDVLSKTARKESLNKGLSHQFLMDIIPIVIAALD